MPGGVIDLGALKATWREKFFAVLMWEGRAPQPTEMYDAYADAVSAAKRFDPTPDVFEIKKITERVR